MYYFIYSDPLLCIDNQHLLQCHTATFIPASGDKDGLTKSAMLLALNVITLIYLSYYGLLSAYVQVCIKCEYPQCTLLCLHIHMEACLRHGLYILGGLTRLVSWVTRYVHAWYIQFIICRVHSNLLSLHPLPFMKDIPLCFLWPVNGIYSNFTPSWHLSYIYIFHGILISSLWLWHSTIIT